MAVIWVVGLWDSSYFFFFSNFLHFKQWHLSSYWNPGCEWDNQRRICKMREITPGQNPGNSNIYGVYEWKGISEEDGERASKEIEENKGDWCLGSPRRREFQEWGNNIQKRTTTLKDWNIPLVEQHRNLWWLWKEQIWWCIRERIQMSRGWNWRPWYQSREFSHHSSAVCGDKKMEGCWTKKGVRQRWESCKNKQQSLENGILSEDSTSRWWQGAEGMTRPREWVAQVVRRAKVIGDEGVRL